MKIILLHGDNIVESSSRLKAFIDTAKKRNWEIFRQSSDIKTSLSEKLMHSDLFAKEVLYLADEPKKLTKAELLWLKKNSDKVQSTLVIYSQTSLPKTFTAKLPRYIKIEEYTLPKLIFKFLESFYPKNSKFCLRLFHQVSKKQPVEFVLAILARHLRDLYKVQKGISLGYPEWRQSKLELQATKFDTKKLTKIIGELAKADFVSKTSKKSLANSLDLIIATQLE